LGDKAFVESLCRHPAHQALVDYQGSLVLVSHDRHLLRNTVDEFYLVYDKQVEEFKGDLEDYQKWLSEQNSTPENKVSEKVGDNENSVQNRKEQKRREAELRQQTAPLRKKITQLEEKMNKFSSELANVENQLADTELYNAENKEKAWEDYLKLCKVGGSLSYLETLEYANVSNPFEAGSVKKSCSYAKAILEEQMKNM